MKTYTERLILSMDRVKKAFWQGDNREFFGIKNTGLTHQAGTTER